MVYLFCVQSKLNLPEEDFKEFINLFFEKEGSNKIDEPSNISDVQESEKTTKFTENDAPQEEVDINDVKASTTSLNDNGKPRILFEYYFSHVDSNDRLEKSLKNNANIPSNLHITSGMSAKLDFDDQVSQVPFSSKLLNFQFNSLLNCFKRQKEYLNVFVQTKSSYQSRQSKKILFLIMAMKLPKKVKKKKGLQ